MTKLFLLILVSPLIAHSSDVELDGKIQIMLQKSLPRMACNLSVGAPGSLIASPEDKDPNYYFHWIRDSALVTDSLVRLLPHVKNSSSENRIREFIENFAVFSRRLQNSPTPYGAGETRFNVDGSVDSSRWPRPQFDGPALRAITILDELERDEVNLSPKKLSLMKSVLRKDLDSVARHYNDRGFDLWEYAKGFHFYTRMVQEGALLKGQKYFKKNSKLSWKKASDQLALQLAEHWHPELGFITRARHEGDVTDSDGHKIVEDDLGYDTSVSLAVNHASLPGKEFDHLDGRIWSTLWAQESYFLKAFPVNTHKTLGPAIGRNPGDDYYGGNAFFFLTAAFAEHSFHIAENLAHQKGELIADKEHLALLSHVLQRPVKKDEKFILPDQVLAEAFAREGDAFLKTMLDVIPSDGMMAEQMDKKDGSPASARDLSWSYASLLTAILQREEWQKSSVDFSKIDFRCPNPKLTLKGTKTPADLKKTKHRIGEIDENKN